MDVIKVHIVSFGIAKDIIGSKRDVMSLPFESDIASAKKNLIEKYPALNDLAKISFAVGEAYQSDDYRLCDEDELVIIPPVSGG